MARAAKTKVPRATVQNGGSVAIDAPSDFTAEQQRQILEELDQDSNLRAYLKLVNFNPAEETGIGVMIRALAGRTGANVLPLRERLRRQATFLTVLLRTGNLSQAAALAGVHRTTVDYWLEHDMDFREAKEEAHDLYKDIIRAEIHRRAVQGVQKPIFYRGEVVGEVTEYSDSLLSLLAKSQMPEFREKTEIEHSGGIQLIPWAAATEEDLLEGREMHNALPEAGSSKPTSSEATSTATYTSTPVDPPHTRSRNKRLPIVSVAYEPRTVDGEFRELPEEPNVKGDDAPSNTDQQPITFKDFEAPK